MAQESANKSRRAIGGFMQFIIEAEKRKDRTIEELAKEIAGLAHDLPSAKDTFGKQNYAESIMHLAGDIFCSV
jgi:hypothetical protein